MKLQDLAQPQQSKQTAKVFESYFGQGVAFDRMSHSQARNMLGRVRELMREHRAHPSFHRSEQNPAYLKLVVMEQGLSARIRESQPVAVAGMPQQDPNAAANAQAPMADKNKLASGVRKAAGATGTQASQLGKAMQNAAGGKALDATQRKAMAGLATGLGQAMQDPTQASRLQTMLKTATGSAMESKRLKRRLKEASEVQQAQVVLAAQDMVDKMQKMLEEITALQFKDLPALVDSIKNEVGAQQAAQFNADATAALSGLVQNLQGGKQQMEAALGVVTGEGAAPMDAGMGADLGAGNELGAAADLNAAGADLEAGVDDLEAGAEVAADELEAPAGAAADLGRGRR